MSLEQAKKFIERLKTDEAFKAKIMAVGDVAERFKLAKDEGYYFTEEEINTVSSELVDIDLKKVLGGHRGVIPISVQSPFHVLC